MLLVSDPPDEIAEHVGEAATWQFLVVDGDGKPTGVLRKDDVHSALTASEGYGTGPTFRTG